MGSEHPHRPELPNKPQLIPIDQFTVNDEILAIVQKLEPDTPEEKITKKRETAAEMAQRLYERAIAEGWAGLQQELLNLPAKINYLMQNRTNVHDDEKYYLEKKARDELRAVHVRTDDNRNFFEQYEEVRKKINIAERRKALAEEGLVDLDDEEVLREYLRRELIKKEGASFYDRTRQAEIPNITSEVISKLTDKYQIPERRRESFIKWIQTILGFLDGQAISDRYGTNNKDRVIMRKRYLNGLDREAFIAVYENANQFKGAKLAEALDYIGPFALFVELSPQLDKEIKQPVKILDEKARELTRIITNNEGEDYNNLSDDDKITTVIMPTVDLVVEMLNVLAGDITSERETLSVT